MPYQLRQQKKRKSPYHEQQDSPVIFISPGIILGSPGKIDPEKKNGAPDNELIHERQHRHLNFPRVSPYGISPNFFSCVFRTRPSNTRIGACGVRDVASHETHRACGRAVCLFSASSGPGNTLHSGPSACEGPPLPS